MMSNDKIAKILRQHSVPYYEKSGRIYADSMIAFTAEFEQVEDMTGWTSQQLYSWLGY